MRIGNLLIAKLVPLFPVLILTLSASSHAAVISSWTFESSVPTTAGPVAPEVGAGVGTAVGLGGFGNPVGNGSAESWGANSWNTGDYWQFQVSTVGFVDISLSFDQTSSGTGPRDFKLAYSTDGSVFTDFQTYVVLSSSWSSASSIAGSQYSFDLSAVTAVEDAANVYFRLVNSSATSANGGTVGSAGTDRIDNVMVTGTTVLQVPDSLPFAYAALTVIGMVAFARRMRPSLLVHPIRRN